MKFITITGDLKIAQSPRTNRMKEGENKGCYDVTFTFEGSIKYKDLLHTKYIRPGDEEGRPSGVLTLFVKSTKENYAKCTNVDTRINPNGKIKVDDKMLITELQNTENPPKK